MTASELSATVQARRDARDRESAGTRQTAEWKREAAAARAAKLADKISDPELLIFALRSYAQLAPGVWTPAEPFHELTRGRTRRFKNHCTAARRILQIMHRDPDRQMRLPINWRARLALVGLKSLDGACPDLIERTQAFLCGDRPKQEKAAKRDPWWVRQPVERRGHASLHEALAAKTDPGQGDYDPKDPGFDEESESIEPVSSAFSRSKWLQGRISAFLRDKAL